MTDRILSMNFIAIFGPTYSIKRLPIPCVNETYHLTSLTVSLDVTGQFHLVLLDRTI